MLRKLVESITCPRCGRSSHNINDIKEKYCGNCHMFHEEMNRGTRMTPTEVTCSCVLVNRNENETQREWFKRWMCQFHWMQTNYYQAKLKEPEFPLDVPRSDEPLRLKLDK